MVAMKERKIQLQKKKKNTKARRNFNNHMENKEIKSSNKWVCINVLIWN